MNPDSAAVEAALAPHLPDPGMPVSVSPIATGKFNSSYYIRSADVDWVVRVAPADDSVFLFYERNMMLQEPGIHSALLSRTSVPVPPVVALDTSRTAIDRNFLVLERLPGKPMSEAGSGDPDVLREVGAALAETHGITAHDYGYLGEHQPMPKHSTWLDAFVDMWDRLLLDIEASGHYNAEEGAAFRRLLDRNSNRFDRNVPASLLHMDVWAQNILVNEEGRLSGLLDWDRAVWGDPEIEFAVLDYCGISRPEFWDGYGAPRDESPDSEIRRIFYLLYELQKYIVIEQGRCNNAKSAREYKEQAFQLAAELP
jgi:aminoglycoside phosphotransferase (APT) family kinase protein